MKPNRNALFLVIGILALANACAAPTGAPINPVSQLPTTVVNPPTASMPTATLVPPTVPNTVAVATSTALSTSTPNTSAEPTPTVAQPSLVSASPTAAQSSTSTSTGTITEQEAQTLVRDALAKTNAALSFRIDSETSIQFGTDPDSKATRPLQVRVNGSDVYAKFTYPFDPTLREYMVVDGTGYLRGPASELEITDDAWYLAPSSHHASDAVAYARLFADSMVTDLSHLLAQDSVDLDGQTCRVFLLPAEQTLANVQTYAAAKADPVVSAALSLSDVGVRFWVCEDGYLRQIELAGKSDSTAATDLTLVKVKSHYADLDNKVAVEPPDSALPLPEGAVARGSGGLGGPAGTRDVRPAWSPDGKQIAFESDRGGNSDIYIMDADGSNVVQLTSDPYALMQLPGPSPEDGTPGWSPDGKRIVFVSGRNNIFWLQVLNGIFVMNADGSEVVSLTEAASHSGFPAWSPDGKQIAFTSFGNGGDIVVMNADGSEKRNLTLNGGNNLAPAWSPDGKRIAFSSAVDGVQQILIMDADGSNIVQLTQERGGAMLPAWSPDGRRIAFVAVGTDTENISVMNADGTEVTLLSEGKSHDGRPAWSPNGKQIAFSSSRDGDWDVYVMDIDGANLVQLTGKAEGEQ